MSGSARFYKVVSGSARWYQLVPDSAAVCQDQEPERQCEEGAGQAGGRST